MKTYKLKIPFGSVLSDGWIDLEDQLPQDHIKEGNFLWYHYVDHRETMICLGVIKTVNNDEGTFRVQQLYNLIDGGGPQAFNFKFDSNIVEFHQDNYENNYSRLTMKLYDEANLQEYFLNLKKKLDRECDHAQLEFSTAESRLNRFLKRVEKLGVKIQD